MARSPLDVVAPQVDAEAEAEARAHQLQLTKPAGALAALEEIAIALAAMQGSARPAARPAEALLFAADHPVAAAGVSAYPAEVTAQMVANFLGGGAAASVLCRKLGIPLTVIDVGVARAVSGAQGGQGDDGDGDDSGDGDDDDGDGDGEFDEQTDPGLEAHTDSIDPKIVLRREAVADDAEGDLRLGEAMSPETFERAVAAGAAAVDRLDEETRVLILGEMGIGNSTCAAAVAAALLDRDGGELTGAGTGVAGEVLARKREVVRAAAALVRGASPAEILRRVGGRELAALAGAVGRAAERRICVLVDGFIVSAAVLAAVRASPSIRPYLLFGHASAEHGHRAVLEALEARPLLQLGLRLGEGSGALAAFPLLELACSLHEEMATFSSAKVAGAASAS